MTIWVSPRGRARHDVRVKVCTTHGDRMDPENTAVVGVRPEPRLVEGPVVQAQVPGVVAEKDAGEGGDAVGAAPNAPRLHRLVQSSAQEVAKAAPAGAGVVKAFNTIFRHVLEKGRPDVFIAGDNAQAKASVEAFIESLGMRPGKVHAVLAASTEITSGIGFAVGLLTPLTAAGCIGIMTVAAWTHKNAFFVFKDGWEYNMILGVLYALVATVGPGRWSLDNAFGIADDLSGTVGLILSLLGVVAAVGLLAVFWRPEPAAPEPAAEPQAG